MHNKKCPFCKKQINVNDAQCPHCKRTVFERITPKLVYEESHRQKPGDKEKTSKIIRWKQKIEKLLSNIARSIKDLLIGRCKRPIYGHKGDSDKLKIIGVALSILIFVIGVYMRSNNLSIFPLFSQDKSRYYMHTFKSIGDELAANVKSVAKLKGTRSDYRGRTVNQYIYKNSNLNISLFSRKLDVIDREYVALKKDVIDGRLPNKKKRNEVLNYYKSVYFFAINELWFRAYDNGQINESRTYINKLSLTIKDDVLNEYLKNTNQLKDANKLLYKLRVAERGIGAMSEIKRTRRVLDAYKKSGSYDKEYNYYVSRYNKLVPKYNAGIAVAKDIFSDFVDLIDVYLLFPGQSTIGQTTYEASSK